jgi:TIR domain
MGKIFISYRRDDDPAAAARVRDGLARTFGNANLFIDVDDLLAGQRFDEELAKALRRCDVLIAAIGQHWMELLQAKINSGERDHVREEIAAALQRRIVVIPVRVGREGQLPPLPRAGDLPSDISELVLYQKHDVTHERFGRDIAELVEAIRGVRRLNRPKFAVRQVHWGWIGAIVGLLLTISYAGIYNPAWWRGGQAEQAASAEAEAKRRADEQAKAEEDRKRAEAEAKRRADEQAKAEEDRKRAEAEAKRGAGLPQSAPMPLGMTFFVTSTPIGKGGDLGGLAGADRHCQQLAAAAGAGGKTWRAYLSSAAPTDKGINARDRIGNGPWQNSKGVVIARNVDDLHSANNKLSRDTALTERGAIVTGIGFTPVWHDVLTGSDREGRAFPGNINMTCNNWSSSEFGKAMLGHSDRTGLADNEYARSWNSSHQSRGCSQADLIATGGNGLFYCFAQ